jgi:hypothetical protein
MVKTSSEPSSKHRKSEHHDESFDLDNWLKETDTRPG